MICTLISLTEWKDYKSNILQGSNQRLLDKLRLTSQNNSNNKYFRIQRSEMKEKLVAND